MSNVLIIGATSAIAVAFARAIAERGGALHLIARDEEELERLAADLGVRYGVPAGWTQLAARDISRYEGAFAEAARALGTIDGVCFALGMLGDQAASHRDAEAAAEIAETNYVSAVRMLTIAANYLEQQAKGFMVVVSSVAGERGRPSNYVYGSAKGALSLFAQGLRARLSKRAVHVLTVKPGFVDTKMTFGRPGRFLVASPQYVGRAILKALDARKDIVYVPPFWSLIMMIIRSIPEPLFKRLNL